MRAPRPRLLGLAFAALSLCAAARARAQIGASASLESDDRLRGLSLSDGRPTLSVNLAYDHPSGVYAGVSAVVVDTAHSGVQPLGYTGYLGYAARIKSGLTWDVGAANASVTSYRYGRYTYDYSEFYVGLTSEHISAHAYISPAYLGEDISTLYVDLDGALNPAPQWRLFGHVGVLSALDGREEPGARARQYDLRLGVVRTFKSCELRLAWTGATSQLLYPAGYRQSRGAVLLGASYFF